MTGSTTGATTRMTEMADRTPPTALTGLAEARELTRELHALADVTEPPTIAQGALARLGLLDEYFTVASPLGPVYIAYNARGVSAVRRARDAESFERDFAEEFGRRVIPEKEQNAKLAHNVAEVIQGERKRALRYDLRGVSEFERAVLMKALEIPRGEVRPYGWIAREIGRPGASRAVGSALKRNPVPLLIPCHRVVRSDGLIGEYALGGSEAKKIALAAESVDAERLEALAREGIRYAGSDTTHVYCFPTCRHARRVTPTHQMWFTSEAAARSAGYRPCRVCRPA
jgi:O-6-methylguanine DNA methyltransferase